MLLSFDPFTINDTIDYFSFKILTILKIIITRVEYNHLSYGLLRYSCNRRSLREIEMSINVFKLHFKKKLDIQFVILLLLLESSFKERKRERERI